MVEQFVAGHPAPGPQILARSDIVAEDPQYLARCQRTNHLRHRQEQIDAALAEGVEGGGRRRGLGIGPDDLRVRELFVRLSEPGITEVILATDPNLEGEATATYLARMIAPLQIAVSRLASGLPVGGDLEYADEITLGRAFEGRRRLNA